MKAADVLRVQDYLRHIELAIERIRRYLARTDRAAFLAKDDLPTLAGQVAALRAELQSDSGADA